MSKEGLATAKGPGPQTQEDLAESLSSRSHEGPIVLQRLRSLSGSLLPALVAGGFIVAVLEVVHRVRLFHELIFPSPFSVVAEIVHQGGTAHLWENMWVTVQEAMMGFGIAVVIGLTFGLAIGLIPLVYRSLYPYLIFIQSMPKIALAPVFIAVFGFGMGAKVITAVAIAFFPVLINTMVGLRETDENARLLMRSMCASRRQMFLRLMLPSALPAIFGGLKIAVTLAFIGAIVGELEAANAGLGRLIQTSAYQLRMASVFGYITWLALMALAIFRIMEFIDKKLIFWKESHQ